MAQVAIGQGQAEYRGELISGGEALKRAGITPLVLSGKDGLALISANGVSIGHTALVVARAERVTGAADVAAALSMEATSANLSIIHPAVGRAKPIPGQVDAADHLQKLLTGSALLEPGTAKSVQDALSFRVVPQVHGALREYVTAARNAMATELNASDDNPLASVTDQAMISNGNFHPIVLAIACDALRIALLRSGSLASVAWPTCGTAACRRCLHPRRRRCTGCRSDTQPRRYSPSSSNSPGLQRLIYRRWTLALRTTAPLHR
jgi:histidine ammonia-lyase